MSGWAIEAIELVKKFPRKAAENGDAPKQRKRFFSKKAAPLMFTAVDGVSLQIGQGEIFGLLGPNGAGKSTTIRMLCTLLEPTSGTARINGYDVTRQANQVRASLGAVLGGERSIYWKLTARENLEYFAALYHLPPEIARKRIDELLERVELADRQHDLVEKYSSGMKQRVAIARSMLSRPPILLLDEPTLGLDPQAARRLRELVKELRAEGHTILLTTHYMEEADQLSDRIGIIDGGKIIALDTPQTLKAGVRGTDVIHLEIAGWHQDQEAVLQALPGVSNLISRRTGEEAMHEVSLHAADSRLVLPQVIERVNTNGTHLVNLRVEQPSLEDVFIHLTGKALRD
ncbi:MAG: ABC transporter ATP-binding protein [Chloroflexi bacterium RBG_16_57_11]|nr:MAG: ABC transporter ATP-binding protein [Chloroflexi bacterium RBG_16_57_11]